jgi:alpha-tubulin suppressor-like RCC1 family protein
LLAVVASLLAVGPAPAAGGPEAALIGVQTVTAGDDHSCALLTNGQVRCWGDNSSGQLGNGDLGDDRPVPDTVRNVADSGPLTGVIQIDAGAFHTCARLETGRAVCWGEDGAGQLGDGGGGDRDTPVFVRNAADTAALASVAEVAAGGGHSCARLTNGQARCWGANGQGQIGNNDQPTDAATARTVVSPTGTGALSRVAEIDAGDDHTCARATSGLVRCWGEGGAGRLGHNGTADQEVPVTVVGIASGTLTGVTQVGLGADSSCARLNNGKVVCWGDNSSAELGDGTVTVSLRPGLVVNAAGDDDLSGVLTVEVGSSHACARVGGGQLRCWGSNDQGELGIGSATAAEPYPIATRNGADTAAIRNVTNVSGGRDHRCVRLANGTVRCFGDNSAGQLGNGDTPDDSALPVVVVLGP